MLGHRLLPRRRILQSAVAVAGLAAVAPARAALPQFTPNQVMGPFYPVDKPLDRDADLTVIAGKDGRAEGQVLHLMGRVVDSAGPPITGARVEIWQANTHGRYTHPADTNAAPLDPNFDGFGVQVSDAQGRYRFKTIKPGAYPVAGDWIRPPHIHFDVFGRTGRVLTQMYFADEPLNDVDPLLKSAFDPAALIAAYQPPSGTSCCPRSKRTAARPEPLPRAPGQRISDTALQLHVRFPAISSRRDKACPNCSMSQQLALAASKESEDWSLITSWERFVKIDGKVKAIGEARPGDECLGQMDLRTRLATEFGSSDGCGQNTILRIGELTFCFFNFRGIWEIRVILDHNVGMISWSSRWSITDGEARVPSAPEVHEEPGAARTRHVRSPREIHEEENYD